MEEKKWALLLDDIVEKIKEHKIVPIVGPEVFYVDYNGAKVSVQEYIVRELFSTNSNRDLARLSPQSITEENIQLCLQQGIKGLHILSRIFQQANIALTKDLYRLLIIEKKQQNIKLNSEVQRFLEDGEFPLIITTNYFQTLNNLITYNGMEYNPVSYKCEKNKNQDILLPEDTLSSEMVVTHPTIFHIFGTITPTTNLCVLTEEDFLQYIHCLQDTNTCPAKLRQYLRDKYVLTIGCDIPDWTFRMILYSFKADQGKFSIEGGYRNTFIGGAVNQQLDSDFVSFLERIRYYSDNNIYDFLTDISQKLPHKDKPTLFLSICSDDYENIGYVLYKKLSERFQVWFCEEKLSGKGGEAYWKKIREGLETCRYFMPVVTPTAFIELTCAEDTKEPLHDNERGILTEWKYAFEVWHRKYATNGEPYCIPYCINRFRDDFKKVLQRKFDGMLFPLFYSLDGNQHIENVNPQDFSVDMLVI